MLKKEFEIEDYWLGFELRPGTPAEGVPLAKLFPGIDLKDRYEKLNQAAASFDLFFAERSYVSNSRLALESGEFAKDLGHHHSFHNRVFHAYFTELRDIGDLEVLFQIAQEDGLDRDELQAALKERRYAPRLAQAGQKAQRYAVNAVPTFIVNGHQKIVGAQSVEFFREQFKKAGIAGRTPV
ncbi:MAG: DsbA family protein [Desulfomonile tiedjei]|nr:DsbA family protein [Desulfomonile tiedjei]